VIIATRNRAESLGRCLDKIPANEMECLHAELVVVDNGSNDATPDVLERFRRAARFRVVIEREPRPGSGRARNAGIAAASGGILFFTDDDCYIAPGTLAALPRVYAWDLGYAGGRILLYDPSDAFYGVNDLEHNIPIPPYTRIEAGTIHGANMSCRREVAERLGGFKPNLGAGTKFPFDDVDFVARASYAGFWGAHVPELVVYHHHGRKPGAVRTTMHEHDYGRGAYYAAMVLDGHFDWAAQWVKTTVVRRYRSRFLREVVGAARYFAFRLTTRTSTPHRSVRSPNRNGHSWKTWSRDERRPTSTARIFGAQLEFWRRLSYIPQAVLMSFPRRKSHQSGIAKASERTPFWARVLRVPLRRHTP